MGFAKLTFLLVLKVYFLDLYQNIHMPDIKTAEDIETYFPDELSARKWLSYLRWGQWASCPYCGNSKAYFIENGKRYKCADKKCGKKFSLTAVTLLQDTNLPLKHYMNAVFLQIIKRGQAMAWDFEKHININSRTAIIIKDKLDFCWNRINRTDKTRHQIFELLFVEFFNSYEHYQSFKSKKYSTASGWHERFEGVTDISNPEHYSKLISYIQVYLYCTKYIFIPFAEPQELLVETFLWLKDNGIKEYSSDMLLKYINRTISRLWNKFLKEHPKFNDLPRIWNRRTKENMRRNIKGAYLVELTKKRLENKGKTTSEIRSNKQMLDKVKSEIREKRDRRGDVLDFNSHFH